MRRRTLDRLFRAAWRMRNDGGSNAGNAVIVRCGKLVNSLGL
jgi:hypothetical protein